MFTRHIKVLAFILSVSLFNPALASEDSSQRAVAVTLNDSPVLELYRSQNGRFRYELNNAWLLGLSMGISPINLAYDSNSITQRATHFGLYESRRSSTQKTSQILPTDKNKISWFWTFGPTQSYLPKRTASSGIFNVKLDFLSRFSLHSKAGFVVPFGKNWLFGGGIVIEQGIGDQLPAMIPGANSDNGETNLGTFFGLKLTY